MSGKTRQVHYTTPCASTYLKMLMRKVCRVPLFEVTKCIHAFLTSSLAILRAAMSCSASHHCTEGPFGLVLQVVLSHTPFKSLVSQVGAGPVMVAGIGSVTHVARHYGFKHILTPLDVARALPSALPFWKHRAGKPHSRFPRTLHEHDSNRSLSILRCNAQAALSHRSWGPVAWGPIAHLFSAEIFP